MGKILKSSFKSSRQARRRGEGGLFKGAVYLGLRLCGILERGNGERR